MSNNQRLIPLLKQLNSQDVYDKTVLPHDNLFYDIKSFIHPAGEKGLKGGKRSKTNKRKSIRNKRGKTHSKRK